MSILLESLEQKDNQSDNQVPNLGDSHFDDEMLSDEWLLEKVKFWQRLAIGLMLALAVSWVYFIASDNKATQATKTAEMITPQPVKEASKETQATEPATGDSSRETTATQAKKSQYKPKKIAVKKPKAPDARKPLSDQKQAASMSPTTSNENQELPPIEINSYAISDNPSKSVVVINGKFYGVGDNVAGARLIEINKEGISLEFNGQLILVKYP